ncbi:hypothetical protein HYY69_02455 [Candidatus Woesearchaeota archaeon]|nr:hypothetical protein [Candidatus Woesearchaeota archaeon]
MQLYWLIRLPIREKPQNTEVFKELRTMLKQVTGIAEDINTYLKRTRILYLVNQARRRVKEFYSGKKPYSLPLEKRAFETRQYALEKLPYEVPERYGVILDGATITRFASQLDYVALKLITQTPELLYAEAQQREAELRKVA